MSRRYAILTKVNPTVKLVAEENLVDSLLLRKEFAEKIVYSECRKIKGEFCWTPSESVGIKDIRLIWSIV